MSAICLEQIVKDYQLTCLKKDIRDFIHSKENKIVKKKTEICKNYLNRGFCKFSNNCSFAHGITELRDMTSLNESFKTKPCKNFHKTGLCPYGTRCQYLHSEIKEKVKWWGFLQKQYKKQSIPFTFAINREERVIIEQRIDVLRFQKIFNNYVDNNQLPFFKKLCV